MTGILAPDIEFKIRVNTTLEALSRINEFPEERREEIAQKANGLIHDMLRYRDDLLDKMYGVYIEERNARG